MHPNDGRVVSNFIMQALRGDSITIYGDGSQTRSFCYVDDLIDGLVRLMNSDEDCIGPINLGNPNEFTILQLAGKTCEIIWVEPNLDFRDIPTDDPLLQNPTDIGCAMRAFQLPTSALIEKGDAAISCLLMARGTD